MPTGGAGKTWRQSSCIWHTVLRGIGRRQLRLAGTITSNVEAIADPRSHTRIVASRHERDVGAGPGLVTSCRGPPDQRRAGFSTSNSPVARWRSLTGHKWSSLGGHRGPQRDVSVRTVALSNHQEVVVTDFGATYDRDGGTGPGVISIVNLRF